MATGDTITGSLADSLDKVVASARAVREAEGVIAPLCDRVTLAKGTGLSWIEVMYAALSGQRITETTVLDNPQQLSDTALTITPTAVGIQTFILDRVRNRITPKGFAILGGQAQKALERLKDEDGLAMFATATTTLCGTGTTLNSGYISTAVRRISSNTTEAGAPPYRCILHGFQIKDIEDELKAGIGTYVIGEGETARVFREGFRGQIGGAQVFEDANIAQGTGGVATDTRGGVFARDGIILVQGAAPRAVPVRDESKGGGGTNVYHYDEYAFGERSAGHWVFGILSDGTTPTS